MGPSFESSQIKSPSLIQRYCCSSQNWRWISTSVTCNPSKILPQDFNKRGPTAKLGTSRKDECREGC
ncbi:hypothetical protein CSPAE12_01166 [Colletotrichum incanum]|nr:hypothetical protein CSPAE12_01166 [Colletotrichum incanum]